MWWQRGELNLTSEKNTCSLCLWTPPPQIKNISVKVGLILVGFKIWFVLPYQFWLITTYLTPMKESYFGSQDWLGSSWMKCCEVNFFSLLFHTLQYFLTLNLRNRFFALGIMILNINFFWSVPSLLLCYPCIMLPMCLIFVTHIQDVAIYLYYLVMLLMCLILSKLKRIFRVLQIYFLLLMFVNLTFGL